MLSRHAPFFGKSRAKQQQLFRETDPHGILMRLPMAPDGAFHETKDNDDDNYMINAIHPIGSRVNPIVTSVFPKESVKDLVVPSVMSLYLRRLASIGGLRRNQTMKRISDFFVSIARMPTFRR